MLDLGEFDAADLEARLRAHLDATGSGCWTVRGLWHDKDGYPILCVGPHRLRANRVAFHLWCGPIPPGRLICHSYDRAVCVSPAHLYAGTVAENARDRETRRRRIVLAQRRSEARGQLTLFGG